MCVACCPWSSAGVASLRFLVYFEVHCMRICLTLAAHAARHCIVYRKRMTKRRRRRKRRRKIRTTILTSRASLCLDGLLCDCHGPLAVAFDSKYNPSSQEALAHAPSVVTAAVTFLRPLCGNYARARVGVPKQAGVKSRLLRLDGIHMFGGVGNFKHKGRWHVGHGTLQRPVTTTPHSFACFIAVSVAFLISSS